jgi:hypothetical protein
MCDRNKWDWSAADPFLQFISPSFYETRGLKNDQALWLDRNSSQS